MSTQDTLAGGRFTVRGAYTGRTIASGVDLDTAREYVAGYPVLAGELEELAVGELAESDPGTGRGVAVRRIA